MYYTFGQVSSNVMAVAWYDPDYKGFIMGYDDGYKTHLYDFKFLDANSVSGCYQQVSGDTSSGCKYFSGTRSSAIVQEASTQNLGSFDAALALQTYQDIHSGQ